MRTIPAFAVGALLFLPITQSRADSIDLVAGASSESSPLGDFSATLTYTVDSGGTSATLLLSITNTSNPSNGGYLTAVAFDTNGLTVDGFSSSSGNFSLVTGAINTQPFGTADFGASATTNGPASNHWVGGGNPSGGLSVGSSATFTWTLSGSVGGLTASDFSGVLVRFRGFEDGGSDKRVGTPGKPNNPVPEPSSIALAFLGAGAVLARRRRQAQAEATEQA